MRKKQSSKTRKSKPYHHGDLRAAILEEAVPLLRELGPQGFNIRALSKRLKVSGAAPYRHFKSKDEIFFRITEEGFRALAEGFRKSIAPTPLNPSAQLLNLSLSYYNFAVTHPEHMQLMFGNVIPVKIKQTDPSLNEAATEVFGILISVVRSCQLVNALPLSTPSDILMVKIWSIIHGYSILESNGLIAGTLQSDYDRLGMVRELLSAAIFGLNKK